MMVLNNEKELKKALNNILKEAMTKASEDIKKDLNDYIWVNWYLARPESEFYERTYQFINSLTIKPVYTYRGELKTDIYFDISKIEANWTGTGFNQHMSFDGSWKYDNENISWHLLNWLEVGNNGIYGNNPIKGIHYLQKINDYYETGGLDRIIRRTFQKYGIVISKL